MCSDLTIAVENASKCYQIFETPRARLQQFIVPRLRERLGLEPRRYYQEFWALKDVSFEVKQGETVGIIGRNGSGKSTLLQLVCGTLSPTAGKVETRGRISALLELGSGFNPEFTGRENVFMNAAILGVAKHEIENCFDEIVAFADIGHFLDQPVKNYSSGMVVRLAFAVQATIDPQILVVDEALAVGDEKFQRKCFARLEALKANGTSILFVSHSASSIIELCDRALFLEQGTRMMYTKPARAVRAYQKLIYAPAEDYQALVASYLASDRTGEEPKPAGAVSPNGANAKAPDVQGSSYDPGLVSETIIVYPVQGAEISEFSLLDESGRKANILESGRIYSLDVKGRFEADFAGVFVGVHIRNVSGAVITGQRFPEEGVYLDGARAGQAFSIRFSFRMSLMPGVYFIGGGIWSMDEPACAHRIMDALVFRIAPVERQISFGYVDLLAAEPSLEFRGSTHEA